MPLPTLHNLQLWSVRKSASGTPPFRHPHAQYDGRAVSRLLAKVHTIGLTASHGISASALPAVITHCERAAHKNKCRETETTKSNAAFCANGAARDGQSQVSFWGPQRWFDWQLREVDQQKTRSMKKTANTGTDVSEMHTKIHLIWWCYVTYLT